ncbi:MULTISPECIES: hypothetical protein [unclassified Pseudonocardia]|uniref:hypothetical protein n=1 Tax=unclassified Pseudonocardia TaxID=2619320 RepID=UPI0011AEBB83|nr:MULTISPECIES: hypothetical protein [unclassified Pseudonocardia]
MRQWRPLAALDLGGRAVPIPRPEWTDLPEPGALAGLFGGRARHAMRVAQARQDYEHALDSHEKQERLRQRWVDQEHARHAEVVRAHCEELNRHNAAVTAFAERVSQRDRESVQEYVEMVLDRTQLPCSVPHQVEVAYNPLGEQADVRFELPPVDVVPTVASYNYVVSSATTKEKPRPAGQIA